jgi:Leucine-rich repeat (LRR) protein
MQTSPTTTTMEENNVQQQQENIDERKETDNQQQEDNENQKKLVSQQIHQMFTNISQVVQGEMQAGFNELTLLQNMNDHVANRYEGMVHRTESIQKDINEMKQQCKFVTHTYYIYLTIMLFSR